MVTLPIIHKLESHLRVLFSWNYFTRIRAIIGYTKVTWHLIKSLSEQYFKNPWCQRITIQFLLLCFRVGSAVVPSKKSVTDWSFEKTVNFGSPRISYRVKCLCWTSSFPLQTLDKIDDKNKTSHQKQVWKNDAFWQSRNFILDFVREDWGVCSPHTKSWHIFWFVFISNNSRQQLSSHRGWLLFYCSGIGIEGWCEKRHLIEAYFFAMLLTCWGFFHHFSHSFV